jgi:uncharacterized LabA/DUF88 family protein
MRCNGVDMQHLPEKAMVYLDINNLFFIYKKLDFTKLSKWLKAQYDCIRVTGYNAIDHKSEGQLKFNVYLSHNGYRVIDPDITVMTNCDNIIITDLCSNIGDFDHKVIVLVSCDGDYSYTLSELSKKGYIVHIIGAREKTSGSLVNISDRITYLEEIPGVILS